MNLNLIKIIFSSILGYFLIANWTADTSNAKINFSVKGPFGTVHGSFSGLKATIQFDENDLAASSFSASVDATTVSTGIGLRNSDLRNEEVWFNTDKYPTISFKSKKIIKSATGFTVQGELTLKATTKPIEIPFTFTSTGNTGAFKGQFVIKREDYKLGKSGGSVGNEVSITLDIPVKK
jgi:polyisoprenoid-binding protein YceI